MATNTTPTKPPVRSTLHGGVGELSLLVNASDIGAATGLPFKNAFPSGAQILSTVINVKTAFSAGGGLTVGSAPGETDLVAAADSSATAAGVKRPDTATAASPLAADTVPYATVTGAPAAGQAIVTFTFIAPRPTA